MRRQPFVQTLRAHRAQLGDLIHTKADASRAHQKADEAERAMIVFMSLGFVERWGWLLFGHEWLTKRIQQKAIVRELAADAQAARPRADTVNGIDPTDDPARVN